MPLNCHVPFKLIEAGSKSKECFPYLDPSMFIDNAIQLCLSLGTLTPWSYNLEKGKEKGKRRWNSNMEIFNPRISVRNCFNRISTVISDGCYK